MPRLDSTARPELLADLEPRPPENIGMTLLRRAALADDALVEGCCPWCHSAEIDRSVDLSPYGGRCRNCGTLIDDAGELEYASHLADALKCYDSPLRKIERHEVAALVEHAAMLHMQVRELTETLRAERARMRKPRGWDGVAA
jgi:hypothetical protein